MAARLRSLGVYVRVYDENISEWCGSEEAVGLGSIGSPYMFAISTRLSQLRDRNVSKLLVGGQGIRGLSRDEFSQLFGTETINGWVDAELIASNLLSTHPPPQERASIANEIAKLSDAEFHLYFSTEVPLYLSQGCRFSCTFCGAQRSDPAQAVRVREKYRDISCVEAELTEIVRRSHALGFLENRFYLSNLDLFQTPTSLSRFVEVARSISTAFPEHRLRFRGLSTTNSFMTVHRKSPDLIHRFVEAGLEQVGFGIDGATPEVWRAIRKPHTKSTCVEAVAVAREFYGLRPEALMVFGHDGHDDRRSLALAVSTVRFLNEEYGAIPRPHVAKSLIPGNDGWSLGTDGWQKKFLLDNPWAFQFLDFTCLPTDVTHQDADFRAAVTAAFLEICAMPNCLTQYVLPEDRRSPHQFAEAVRFNRNRFDI